MDKEKYYVTTPIYYASGDLHVGHCFCTILTDACARFMRLMGKDVMFLTGSDEHGLKISRNAEKAGLSNQQFVDKIVDNFKIVWSRLGISYDKFIRTTDKEHIDLVQKIITKLYNQGDIYLGKYEGLYCVPCETFFTQSQLVDGKCPDCGREVEATKEDCYFFKMSKYNDFIKDLFLNNKEFLIPESRRNEIYNNFVKDGVNDLCISRTSFDWGIKFPFDNKHVVYVWIDALTNYISALGYDSKDDSLFKKFWPADVHFVGRDITRFHSIIWPIMLHALGIALPKQIHSTGFVTLKGDKISKSKSNGFNPLTLCDRYGADSLRYYLLKEGPIYNDTPYSADTFINTINSDLCNNLGNLVSRSIAMSKQYFDGKVFMGDCFNSQDENIINKCNNLLNNVTALMNEQKVNVALKEILSVLDDANKYIDLTTPWLLYKDDTKHNRLLTVLYVLLETIRICTTLLQAFLVEIPNKIFEQLNVDDSLKTFESIKKFNSTIIYNVEKKENIFPRLNVEKEIEFLDKPDEVNQTKTPIINNENKQNTLDIKEITIDDFDKIQLVVGKIINSEKVENADKLLKNTVQIGDEQRTIVSGIAKYYAPSQIIGKSVVVVKNLKPIKLKGIESFGMLLCAVDKTNDTLSLITTDKEIKDGSEVC